MKNIIILFLCISFPVSASTIYKCKNSQGRFTFSDKPCLSNQNTQETFTSSKKEPPAKEPEVKKTVSTKANVAFLDNYTNNSVKTYLEGLAVDKFSTVLSGIHKDSFHGISIDELFQQKKMNLEKWLEGDEALEYMVHIENEYKLFAVSKDVFNREENSHEFLDLSDREVISVLSARDFGKPTDRHNEAEYTWEWNTGKYNCELIYSRNRFNPEKGFHYSCGSK